MGAARAAPVHKRTTQSCSAACTTAVPPITWGAAAAHRLDDAMPQTAARNTTSSSRAPRPFLQDATTGPARLLRGSATRSPCVMTLAVIPSEASSGGRSSSMAWARTCTSRASKRSRASSSSCLCYQYLAYCRRTRRRGIATGTRCSNSSRPSSSTTRRWEPGVRPQQYPAAKSRTGRSSWPARPGPL